MKKSEETRQLLCHGKFRPTARFISIMKASNELLWEKNYKLLHASMCKLKLFCTNFFDNVIYLHPTITFWNIDY